MSVTQELECPTCWAVIPLDGERVTCADCGYHWIVEPDGDIDEWGRLYDCTSLQLPKDAPREQIALKLGMALANATARAGLPHSVTRLLAQLETAPVNPLRAAAPELLERLRALAGAMESVTWQAEKAKALAVIATAERRSE